MRYSLADYTLSITVPQALLSSIGNFSIGGEGNAVPSPHDSISVEIRPEQWTTESFATGAYVHNKNLARTGTVRISISQLSQHIEKFKNFANVMYSGDYNGATLSLSQNAAANKKSGEVMKAVDCYITKIPAQEFGESAGKQTWEFTCGEITFN